MRTNKNAPDSSAKTIKGYDLLLQAKVPKTT